MENEGLYPSLLAHDAPEVRSEAERLHRELGPIYGLVDDFIARWDTADAIEARTIRFRIELARLIGKLGLRMREENRVLYPLADQLDRIR